MNLTKQEKEFKKIVDVIKKYKATFKIHGFQSKSEKDTYKTIVATIKKIEAKLSEQKQNNDLSIDILSDFTPTKMYLVDKDGNILQEHPWIPLGNNIFFLNNVSKVEELVSQKTLFIILEGDNEGEKISEEISIWASCQRINVFLDCMEDKNNPKGNVKNEKTYLILYGSGWIRPEDAGRHGDLKDQPKKSAYAQYNKLKNRKGISPNQVKEPIYTPTEKDFFKAIHTKYKTGKIQELYIYAHGTSNSINLGGPKVEDANYEYAQDQRWVSASDQTSICPEENEIKKINRGNFTKNAQVIIRACSIGGHDKEDKDDSHAQKLANHLGGDRKVKAFNGHGGAEYKIDKNGKKIYDGEMIRGEDRGSLKENLTTFKSKEK